jgi:hypothetical protein
LLKQGYLSPRGNTDSQIHGERERTDQASFATEYAGREDASGTPKTAA